MVLFSQNIFYLYTLFILAFFLFAQEQNVGRAKHTIFSLLFSVGRTFVEQIIIFCLPSVSLRYFYMHCSNNCANNGVRKRTKHEQLGSTLSKCMCAQHFVQCASMKKARVDGKLYQRGDSMLRFNIISIA